MWVTSLLLGLLSQHHWAFLSGVPLLYSGSYTYSSAFFFFFPPKNYNSTSIILHSASPGGRCVGWRVQITHKPSWLLHFTDFIPVIQLQNRLVTNFSYQNLHCSRTECIGFGSLYLTWKTLRGTPRITFLDSLLLRWLKDAPGFCGRENRLQTLDKKEQVKGA